MADHDKDYIPMLSDTHPKSVDENADSRFRPFLSRTQSASISIPVDSTESYGSETNLVGFTGPLRSDRKAPLVQMSGPLYINRNTENLFLVNHGVTARKKVEPKPERYPSCNGMDQNDWDDKYTATNAHLMRSGQLGMCNDPYCTTCPSYYHPRASQQRHAKTSSIFDSKAVPVGDNRAAAVEWDYDYCFDAFMEEKFHSVLYGDAKGWARRFNNAINSCIPGVMNPHAKVVQNIQIPYVRVFDLLCSNHGYSVAERVQDEENKCIVIDWAMTKAVVVFRCLTDAIYLLNMLLQVKEARMGLYNDRMMKKLLMKTDELFRLAYVAPESRVVGAGELVDHPKKIAKHYLRGWFLIDLFVIIVLLLLPKGLDSSGANYAKNLLRAVILVQYIPRLFRFIPLLIGQSPNGFIFETALANFFINLFTFVLSGHIIGSCWYLFGLQRVNECLRNACRDSAYQNDCKKFIDCGYGDAVAVKEHGSNPNWYSWKENDNASACFTLDGFSYGIYIQAVNLTRESTITRYTYSLFWGFQNFLQALGRRRSEMSLRRRDVEQWMKHRRLPQELRSVIFFPYDLPVAIVFYYFYAFLSIIFPFVVAHLRVLEAERYHWAATRGVNEEMLLENLPEDLQRDIRRHFYKFVKKVWIFNLMDDHVLDAVCEKLKQKIYIKGSEIFYVGGLVEKMVFIVRGKLESIGHDGTVVTLCEGNVCGEELLTWFLEHSSVYRGADGRKIKISGQRLISSRTVRCLKNVEAFSLSAADLEEVTSLFARNLRNPLVQGAIRYQSPYWRALAATRIQVAWRYRQKRLKQSKSSQSNHSSYSRI
ncbi:unnamed protein product [Dovyalis caffra]|uniref:Cyclic nucleotide-binding domain-containing protein n=1 Tax=Dovyalis caffra TaxID=77055 RepID=A0AAV1R4J0_9ROSI|nr:unnamed protein product [Dovyalis caffra]